MNRLFFEKTLSAGVIICSALMLSGLDRCQQDYYFAVKAHIGPTPTSTEAGTSTPGGPTETPEPEETGTPTPVGPVSTNTPLITGTATPIGTVKAAYRSAALLGALATLDKSGTTSGSDRSGKTSTTSVQNAGPGLEGNWLGKIKGKKDKARAIDSDSDGFTDELEKAAGSDENDPRSVPQVVLRTSLAQRLQEAGDRDGDGLLDADEADIGTSPTSSDSDGDGCIDGVEVMESTDPVSRESAVRDSDGDCLSDESEAELGTNPFSPDTDGDRLSDDKEVVLGTNPLAPDTDNDGILDGKEVAIGSDPLQPENPVVAR